MDIRRRVTALLNGVVFLGSLYLGTTIGAGSWFMTGGLAIAALTLLNVVLLYHRVGGAAAYLLNGALILAGLWALLLTRSSQGSSRVEMRLIGSAWQP